MDLSVQKREKFGKAVRTLRQKGLIPAELYGRGVENAHVAVPTKEFHKVFKEAGTNTVVNLLVENKKHPTLIHDVTKNYLTDEIEHIDFYQVRMDEKIKAKIPLTFIHEAPAVKDKAAILNKGVLEIEVEALPAELPHRLEVDLSALDDFNKSIYIKDLKIPKGVQVLVDPETVIVTATPPVREEEKVEAPVDLGAVKVETEEKKAEREAVKSKKEEPSPAELPKKDNGKS